MDWWVDSASGEVVGVAIEGINPGNFEIVQGPEAASRDEVYFAEGQIQRKPERPSDRHSWINNEWQLPPNPPITERDWDGLFKALQNSSVFGKIYASATENLRSNAAYTLLFSTLTTTHNYEKFVWAIAELREGMKLASTGDFSQVDIDWINSVFSECGFDLQLNL